MKLNSLDVNQINYTLQIITVHFHVSWRGSCCDMLFSLAICCHQPQSSPASRVVPTSELLVPRSSQNGKALPSGELKKQWKMAIEIVDFPINSMVDLSMAKC